MRKLKTPNSDAQLERLKTLLLGPELETLHRLEEELRALDLRCNDPQEIIARIAPVFNRVLRENLEHTDAETIQIFARHLAQIVAEASEHDLSALSRSLQHVIGPAISKEIADNQEAMVDTLYPIMGGMISKYVTQAIKEMMESINRKIEEGLSTQRIKRKIKAKLTGVSETELLLEESGDARILALFVIHKPTGLLVASAQLEEDVVNDAHMVAAMASAVKDFLNDSFALSQEVKEEIQILSYAGATLYIESAGSVYLVAFLDKEPDYELRGDINDFFATVVKKYARFFQHFDGDESRKEVAALTERLRRFLLDQPNIRHLSEGDKKRINPAKWIFAALGAALILLVGYEGWNAYRIAALETYARTHGIDDARLREYNATHMQLEGTTARFESVAPVVRTLSQRLGKPVKSAVTLKAETIVAGDEKISAALRNVERVVRGLKEETRRAMTTLQERHEEETRALRSRIDRLERSLREEKKRLQRYRELVELPKRIRATLNRTMRNSPYYRADKGKLDFASLAPFAPEKTEMKPQARRIFLETTRRYLQALCPYAPYIEQITVEAYSDTSGDATRNLALTEARAAYATALLLDENNRTCFPASRFKSTGYGERFPVIKNGKEDANASRRIEIGYTIDRETVAKKLAEIGR